MYTKRSSYSVNRFDGIIYNFEIYVSGMQFVIGVFKLVTPPHIILSIMYLEMVVQK